MRHSDVGVGKMSLVSESQATESLVYDCMPVLPEESRGSMGRPGH